MKVDVHAGVDDRVEATGTRSCLDRGNTFRVPVGVNKNANTMVRVFEDALRSLRSLGETGKIEVIIHAHVFGRPAGIWAYEEIIRIAQASDDVWLTNWSEVSSHAQQSLTKHALPGDGEWSQNSHATQAPQVSR